MTDSCDTDEPIEPDELDEPLELDDSLDDEVMLPASPKDSALAALHSQILRYREQHADSESPLVATSLDDLNDGTVTRAEQLYLRRILVMEWIKSGIPVEEMRQRLRVSRRIMAQIIHGMMRDTVDAMSEDEQRSIISLEVQGMEQRILNKIDKSDVITKTDLAAYRTILNMKKARIWLQGLAKPKQAEAPQQTQIDIVLKLVTEQRESPAIESIDVQSSVVCLPSPEPSTASTEVADGG
jgi:hypothetical protein